MFRSERVSHRVCIAILIAALRLDATVVKKWSMPTQELSPSLDGNSILQVEVQDNQVVVERDRNALQASWFIAPSSDGSQGGIAKQVMARYELRGLHPALFCNVCLNRYLSLYVSSASDHRIIGGNILPELELDGREDTRGMFCRGIVFDRISIILTRLAGLSKNRAAQQNTRS